MSEENVKVVRASMEAADRGDADTALSYYSENVVFHPLVAGPYHGRTGVAEQMLTWMQEFDDFWFESEEFIDAGEQVVLLWRQGGVGRLSGVKVENVGGTIFSVEDGLIRHAQVYADRAQALAAAGLSQ
jgi:ketosteroid isomerase-like protein